ncbi:MAG: polymer-forming cytoskeletal protein [Gemmatimonadota bacterium]|nr:polymer-forming cytoskeletal protein [Gemmatimonadota bacterium]MDH3422365.1 polymer-forming cytoskeletal protein [Gemmatimonadota bacterium]
MRKDREVVESHGAGAGATALTDDVSIISSDMSIRGACSTRGHLRIEGRIAGDISARGVELAPSGEVDGDVVARDGGAHAKAFVISGSVSGAVRAGRVEVRRGGSVSGGVVADEAVIHGRVSGGVQARTRLALEESAEVEGDVLARRLALKEGGRVNGNIRMGEDIQIEGPEKVAEELQDSGTQSLAQAPVA